MAGKIVPELAEQSAPVQDADLLVSYRGSGPLKRFAASTLKTYAQVGTVLASVLAASGGSALVGFLQAGAGAVLRSLQSKDRDIVSVKDFGALGNGVIGDGTVGNDTVAIQAALAYAATLVRENDDQDSQEAGGVIVEVPEGVYNIDDTLVVVNGVYFRGAGKTSSILQNLTTNKTFVRNDSGAVYNSFSGYIGDMALYGDPASDEQYGVDLLRPYRFKVERVYVQNVGAAGHRVRQSVLSSSEGVDCVGCGIGFLIGGGVESWIDPTPTTNPTMQHVFEDCHAVRNIGPGFRFGPYSNGCTISKGGSEYNYVDAGNNVGYNIEFLNTVNIMENVVVDHGVEGPVKAHVYMNAANATNRLVRLKHYGNGASGNVDRAVIVEAGTMILDTPTGLPGSSYKSIAGSIAPFRLYKASAIIQLTNPTGCTLTRSGAWVEDETGATTDLSNNLFQYSSGVIRGASTQNRPYFGDSGEEWWRDGDGDTQPYVRQAPFFRALEFGSGVASPDVGVSRTGTRTIALVDNNFSGLPRFFDMGSAWDGNHALLGARHVWVDAAGALRFKNGAPASDTDGIIIKPAAAASAIADAVAAVGLPTQAEFNALVTKFNSVLAVLRAQNDIAP